MTSGKAMQLIMVISNDNELKWSIIELVKGSLEGQFDFPVALRDFFRGLWDGAFTIEEGKSLTHLEETYKAFINMIDDEVIHEVYTYYRRDIE